MIALPVTCTPATTTSQAAENHGAMASMAGFRTETSPSRITCQTASAVSPKPTVTPEASLISCRNPARATVLAITAAVATGCARATPSTSPAVCFNAALHAALAGVGLRDLRALLDEDHHRVHARGQRHADVVQLVDQVPRLVARQPRRAAHLAERRGPALQRGDIGERRRALAADGGGHLVGRDRADAMRLADVVQRAAIAADRREQRVVPRPQIIERGAVGGDIRGAAIHAAKRRRSADRCARPACRWRRRPRAG